MNRADIRIALLDNYDSFTFNIIDLLRKCGIKNISMMENDTPDFDKIDQSDLLILSPGPGIPNEAGNLLDVIDRYLKLKPILGICLGHQAIGEYFGAKLIQKPDPAHGQKVKINIESQDSLFFPDDLETTEVGLYHSWFLSDESFPGELKITARDDEGRIMGIRHRTLPVEGVQFHPESYMSSDGQACIQYFLYNLLDSKA